MLQSQYFTFGQAVKISKIVPDVREGSTGYMNQRSLDEDLDMIDMCLSCAHL